MVCRCFRLLIFVPTLLAIGCATGPSARHSATAPHDLPPASATAASYDDAPQSVNLIAATAEDYTAKTSAVVSASQEVPLPAATLPEPAPLESAPVADTATADIDLAPHGTLDVDRLVEDVLARNPSIDAMIAAWRAAAARYPQEIALEDPMFEYAVGPDSWGDPNFDSAYMVMASQKIPWPGKRQLRGRIACAEASAADSQVDDTRLRLTAAAKMAFLDYYAAHRELALNGDNLREMNDFRDSATARLRTATASQQDVLQSDVDLALLSQRQIKLERDVRVATARINTLLHRDADCPLPLPPDDLPALENVSSPAELRETALLQRPDLAALGAEMRAAQAALALACKDFYPDADVYAKYDAFWQEEPLRTAVGMNVNLPIYREKRWAAVREARARFESRRAEFDQLTDEIAGDIQAAHANLEESRQTAELYDGQIIPAAMKNVDSARAGYTAGGVDFLRLVEAERQLIMLREQQLEAVTEYHRQLAELERATGGPIHAAAN